MTDLDKLITGLTIFKKYNKNAQVFFNTSLFQRAVLEIMGGSGISKKDRKTLNECGWIEKEFCWVWYKPIVSLDGYGYY